LIGTAVTIGILLSFAFTEVTGLLAGGLVVPGYLALYLDQPLRIVATLAVAWITFMGVRAVSNFMVLFGRRRFMAMVVFGMFIGYVLGRAVAWLPETGQELRVVGYIIPGLIANDASRQGFLKTAACVLIVAGLTRLILILAFRAA